MKIEKKNSKISGIRKSFGWTFTNKILYTLNSKVESYGCPCVYNYNILYTVNVYLVTIDNVFFFFFMKTFRDNIREVLYLLAYCNTFLFFCLPIADSFYFTTNRRRSPSVRSRVWINHFAHYNGYCCMYSKHDIWI